MNARKLLCAAGVVISGALASFEAGASTDMHCTIFRTGNVVGGCEVYLGPLEELNVNARLGTELSCGRGTKTWSAHFNTLGIRQIGMTYLAREVDDILIGGEENLCSVQGMLQIHAAFTYLCVASDYTFGFYNYDREYQ